MVLGSFQCCCVLLLLHIVGQRLAVLAAGVGRVGYIFLILFIYLPFLMSCLLGDGWTWLKYCSFGCWTPSVVVSYCRGRPRLVLVKRLEGLSLPRNSTTINWPARHDLVVDCAVKPQHKQTNNFDFLLSTYNIRMFQDWRRLLIPAGTACPKKKFASEIKYGHFVWEHCCNLIIHV